MNGQLRHVKTFNVAPARPRMNSFQLRPLSPRSQLVLNLMKEMEIYSFLSTILKKVKLLTWLKVFLLEVTTKNTNSHGLIPDNLMLIKLTLQTNTGFKKLKMVKF